MAWLSLTASMISVSIWMRISPSKRSDKYVAAILAVWMAGSIAWIGYSF